MNQSSAELRHGPLPPMFLLGAMALMAMLHGLVPLTQLLVFPWRALGAIFIVAGLGLNIWASGLFKQVGTAIKPFAKSSSLILDGPFRLSRNPMYLGMIVLLIGIAIGLGSVTPWLVIPAFVVLVSRRFVVAEEHKMEVEFGAKYLAYCARVRRWL